MLRAKATFALRLGLPRPRVTWMLWGATFVSGGMWALVTFMVPEVRRAVRANGLCLVPKRPPVPRNWLCSWRPIRKLAAPDSRRIWRKIRILFERDRYLLATDPPGTGSGGRITFLICLNATCYVFLISSLNTSRQCP